MSVRLVILILLAGGMALYFAAGKNKAPTTIEVVEVQEDELPPEEKHRLDEERKTLAQRPLPGREPEDPPEAPEDFSVVVEVDHSSGKNRLYFNISEKHGYYVETFRLLAWYKKPGVTGPENSPLTVPDYVNDYLKANDTLRRCIEIVPAELSRVGGDMGTSENWEARIDEYNRARVKDPDPLPRVTRMHSCD